MIFFAVWFEKMLFKIYTSKKKNVPAEYNYLSFNLTKYHIKSEKNSQTK